MTTPKKVDPFLAPQSLMVFGLGIVAFAAPSAAPGVSRMPDRR
jgi:Na+-transporting methylmalonyl-CoA/oxaloacetate decarboxylase beta subunit